MTRPATPNPLSERLHISHSQIFTYLTCSLKYRFRYLLKQPVERIGLALPFGSAIHKAIEHYYWTWQCEGRPAPLDQVEAVFVERVSRELTEKKDLIVYNKETPDREHVVRLGRGMLAAFHEAIDLGGWRVLDVELPLRATLYTADGRPTDFDLVGYIDLLLQDDDHRLLVVDHKTAARAKSQAEVDADLQMTAYSYLLAANRYVFPSAPVQCRFDVLRKLKTPKLEHYHTCRNAESRKRLARIAVGVLAGIEAGVFVPHRSWMCSDCEYARACADWHNQ